MDGVLEGAAVLCVCKLACSLLFLPSSTASHSSVSFCCCCLLVFTDFLFTVFLSFLWIFESWQTEQTPLGDVIALRFLLFLSYTYSTVLLLTTPLIAVETLARLLKPLSVVAHWTGSQTVGSDGQCHVREVTVEEKEDSKDIKDKEWRLSHDAVSYLSCLSVWVLVALDVRWRLKREEVRATACLHATNSLIRCLPNLFSPMSSTVNPCWGIALLFLLLLLITMSTGLHSPHKASAQAAMTHMKHGVNNNGNSCWQDLVPELFAPSKPLNSGMLKSEPAQYVDPGKTESSCTVHREYSWNNMQMSVHHHGDFVLMSAQCASAVRGQEPKRTKKGIPLTFITEEPVDSQYRSQSRWRQWGFPCPGVNIMIGFVSVLSTFVLPLNFSVNIILIRTIETSMECCIRCLVSSAANTSNASTSHNETLV